MEQGFALVIGHGDDAQLLERNIGHHRELGASPIVVSTYGPDAEVAAIVRGFGDGVHHRIAGQNGEDEFRYFEHAAHFIEAHFAPAWIGCVDTDEFIVTRSGRLEPPANHYDLRAIRRYNAVPQRNGDGTVVPPDLDDLRSIAIVDGAVAIETPWSAGDTRIAYVRGADLGAKIVVRPHVLSAIAVGAHGITSAATFVPRIVDCDALIVHLPFTTYARFRKKVDSIRELLRDFGDRFQPWHWRHWAKMNDRELEAEFDRQIVDVRAAGELTTPRAILDQPPISRTEDWIFAARILTYDPPAPAALRVPAGSERIAALVDPLTYASRYPDIAAAQRDEGLDVVAHFMSSGLAEGRRPSYAFDPHVVDRAFEPLLGRTLGARDLYWKYFDLEPRERVIPNTWFDHAWFQRTYGAHDDPWSAYAYYLEHVAERAFSPNAWFDEVAYRNAHPGLAASIEAGTFVCGVQHAYATGIF